jgi:hypothetical protein
MNCDKCGYELAIGDYPFCRGDESDHITPASVNAQRFSPIVVHRNMETGEYSFPARNDDPAPAGYDTVSITTFREADRLCKSMSDKIRSERVAHIEQEKAFFEARTAERRANIKSELYRRLGKTNSKIFDRLCEVMDKKREKRYRDMLNKDPNFHIQAVSFDQGNQREYIDDYKKRISVHVNRGR